MFVSCGPRGPRHYNGGNAMINAVREWNDGRECWYVADGREWIGTFTTRDEARAAGAVEFTETDEPRFLVRDGSGRGWCAETLYSSFTADERSHNEDEEDEYSPTFGEWLDSSSAGDEYSNSDTMQTIIRIN